MLSNHCRIFTRDGSEQPRLNDLAPSESRNSCSHLRLSGHTLCRKVRALFSYLASHPRRWHTSLRLLMPQHPPGYAWGSHLIFVVGQILRCTAIQMLFVTLPVRNLPALIERLAHLRHEFHNDLVGRAAETIDAGVDCLARFLQRTKYDRGAQLQS